MGFPVDKQVKEFILDYFLKRNINYNEDSLIKVIENSCIKQDVYWSVIALRDIGTEKCIPSLKTLVNFPMRDVKDCTLLTIAHILGSKETEFYVSILQAKGTQKEYPMWAIKECADERAVEAVTQYLISIYQKWKQPKGMHKGHAYVDGLIYLSKYYNDYYIVREIYNHFIEIQDKIPEEEKIFLQKKIPFFKENLKRRSSM